MKSKLKKIEKQLIEIANMHDNIRILEMFVLDDIKELGIDVNNDEEFDMAWSYLGGDCWSGALIEYINEFVKNNKK